MERESEQRRHGYQGLYDPYQAHDACGVGFVVQMKGTPSHQIVRDALVILCNLNHRGGCGCEPETGDGAGVLLQIPHDFFQQVCQSQGLTLGEQGSYGVGMLFLPQNPHERTTCERVVEEAARQEGLEVLGWRDVPTKNTGIGPTARRGEPVVRQIFVSPATKDSRPLEQKLYVVRKLAENRARALGLQEEDKFCVVTLSSKLICYKGMLTPSQVSEYYPDLCDERLSSALAVVHSRYSTNTLPSWRLAQPFRMLCHNGEINTLRGNKNWMRTRQSVMRSEVLKEDLSKLFPVVDESGSDSACFDNALEFLVASGRSLSHALMMMIPEAWENHTEMAQEKRDFYEYYNCVQEPWDGPASIVVTDGDRVGAVLDRNGLRPSRYIVTDDDRVIMASEVGVLPDIPPEKIVQKWRLQPGKTFLVDLQAGRMINDEEIKHSICNRQPYGQWLREQLIVMDDLPVSALSVQPLSHPLWVHQLACGYNLETKKVVLGPMAETGQEPTGSMGDDTPLAVLSKQSRLLYDYFKQLFAQVTNPPIDPIREAVVMSLYSYLGAEGNLLEETPQQCNLLKLDQPILTNEDLERVRQIKKEGFRVVTVPIVYPVAHGPEGIVPALEWVCTKVSQAVDSGACVVVLSDREVDREHVAIPSLLAAGAVHHHLIRQGQRTLVGLVMETGEAREVPHIALLIGYGVGAINPYLAFETIADMHALGELEGVETLTQAYKNYIKALNKGLLKIFSKMGISTLSSYRGAQIFEAVGLNSDMIDRYFTNTPSRIEGVGVEIIAQEALVRHAQAYPQRVLNQFSLPSGGFHHFRQDGEHHQINPEMVSLIQQAVRQGDYAKYKQFSDMVSSEQAEVSAIRRLFRFKPQTPIPIEEVEPASEIVKRFCTGAMSFGSISREAHETLAIAMNRLGGRSNTGEGGEDPGRWQPDPNGDSRRSAIKQVASGRFGVTINYLVNADELQIKMAQGAKPGEGGQLPGHKVSEEIAQVRYSTPGVTLISPPPHHDIYSIEDLAQLIFDLKNANRFAKVSVKLVSEVGVGTVATGVAKGKADLVLISGHDGGTGASPISSIKYAGLPWEIGLAETHQMLVENNLRGRIVVQTDGQMKTGRDVVIAGLLGAEEMGFSTIPLLTLGCIMMRKCHLNTCPVGVATQDPELRRRFTGKPEYVVNYFHFVAEEVREIMAQLGFRKFEELIGHVEVLDTREAVGHWKARGLDFSRVFYSPQVPSDWSRRCVQCQEHELEQVLDMELLERCRPALETGAPVTVDLPIKNVDRTAGTILSSEVARCHGLDGLPEDTINITFRGSAGQSLGAWLAPGVTIKVLGDANDYTGKGLSGGKLIVQPPATAPIIAEDNILIGNVALYGATKGEAFFRGVAGERFCVRNSGAWTVVEGVGDHGCEYMTGGRVVVIGRTGRNFAAGMSGGIAYVLDEKGDFSGRCNQEMVALESLDDPEDIETVCSLLQRHRQYTDSPIAAKILDQWSEYQPKFVKVMPLDYRAVLQAQKAEREFQTAQARQEG